LDYACNRSNDVSRETVAKLGQTTTRAGSAIIKIGDYLFIAQLRPNPSTRFNRINQNICDTRMMLAGMIDEVPALLLAM